MKRAAVKRMLVSDLKTVGLWTPALARIHVAFCPLDVFGLCWTDETDSVIQIHKDLRGGVLYSVLLHEYGHSMGLDHARSGVMTPYTSGRPKALTLRNRRRWVGQVARALLKKRIRGMK